MRYTAISEVTVSQLISCVAMMSRVEILSGLGIAGAAGPPFGLMTGGARRSFREEL